MSADEQSADPGVSKALHWARRACASASNIGAGTGVAGGFIVLFVYWAIAGGWNKDDRLLFQLGLAFMGGGIAGTVIGGGVGAIWGFLAGLVSDEIELPLKSLNKVVIGLILVPVGLCALGAMRSDSHTRSVLSNSGHVVEERGIEVGYTDAINKEEAQRFLNYLVSQWNPNSKDGHKSVLLDRTASRLQVKCVVSTEKLADQNVLATMQDLANRFSTEVFSGAPVDLHLCDNKFNANKTLSSGGTLGTRLGNTADTIALDNALADAFNAVWATNIDSSTTFERATRKLAAFELSLEGAEYTNADNNLRRCSTKFIHISYRRLGLWEKVAKLRRRIDEVMGTALTWNSSSIENFLAEAAVKLGSGALVKSGLDEDLSTIRREQTEIREQFEDWEKTFTTVRTHLTENYNIVVPDRKKQGG